VEANYPNSYRLKRGYTKYASAYTFLWVQFGIFSNFFRCKICRVAFRGLNRAHFFESVYSGDTMINVKELQMKGNEFVLREQN